MEFRSNDETDAITSSMTSTTAASTDAQILDSPAIKRLIEEVRHEEVVASSRHYNRQHNRHNR